MNGRLHAIATTQAPTALGAYSQAVMANGFVFVSGQLGIDPATGELDGRTAAQQASRALKNIANILSAAGCGMEHVCKATIYLKNVEDFKEVDAEYARAFTSSVKPARVAFGNNMIPKGALVEIEVIAVLPQQLS
ncbi:regulator [Bifidobacterium dolichotidis]|uniref:Regulator n=1 Tax=Bifidobacterium dolichotidis TaxID=2306976 RepID=A0A430FRJ8_9BIFI|nr:Rid family detoxifying hydrolase [Bifidobacterium dolichotidis]RSX55502.1 regulator [Bifidobacterium dolichotidis]